MAEDEEEIEFEYESDGEFYGEDSAADEQAILLENSFYEAQDMQLAHPKEALLLFGQVVEKGENAAAAAGSGNVWAFKALSNVVLIHLRLGDLDSAAATYGRLLQLLQHVSRNEAADAISAVLEAVTAETEAASSRLQQHHRQQQQHQQHLQQQHQQQQHQQQQHQQQQRQQQQQGQAGQRQEEERGRGQQQERQQQEEWEGAGVQTGAADEEGVLSVGGQSREAEPFAGGEESRSAASLSGTRAGHDPEAGEAAHRQAAPTAAEGTAPATKPGRAASGTGRQGEEPAAPPPRGRGRGREEEGIGGGGGGGGEAARAALPGEGEGGGAAEEAARRRRGMWRCAAAEIAEATRRLAKLEDMFTQTLQALQKHKVKRLWGRTCCRLVRLYIHRGKYEQAERLLGELRVACQEEHRQAAATAAAGGVTRSSGSEVWGGGEELQGGGQLLLEYFALQMTLDLARDETASLKKLYQEALLLTRAVADPRSIALVREVGGRMHMKEKKWKAAAQDFAEAFKNYQDIGRASQAKTMLQYLVLANLLSQAKINFFDTREAKALLDDPGVAAMHALSLAFENKNMSQAHELLTDPSYGLATDPSIGIYTQEVLETLRLHVLPRVVAPYSCVTLQFLQEQLKSDRYEVLCCLSRAVGDGSLKGFFDDVEEVFWQRSKEEEEDRAAGAGGDSGAGQEILLSTAAMLQQQQQHKSSLQHAGPPVPGVQRADDVWLEAVKVLIAKLNRLSVM